MAGVNEVLSHFRITADTSDARSNVGGLGNVFGSLFGVVAGGVATGNLLSGAIGGIVGSIGSAASAVTGWIGSSMAMNASLESTTLQFETLMKNTDQAKAHVQMLFEFAKKTPFETGPIIEASKQLQVFGGNALNTEKNLTLIGNAAAATGKPINEISMWVGRLYTALQAGRPFGEAAQNLTQLAVWSPKLTAELEKLTKAGASGTEKFAAFQAHLETFDGAMVKQAGTWEGLSSSISDTLSIMSSTAFKPFFDMVKLGMASILDFIGQKGVTTAVQNFGKAAGIAFGIAQEALGPVIKGAYDLVIGWINLGKTGQGVEVMVRGITGVFAMFVRGMAYVIDAVSTVIQTYYEIRIAGNLLLIAFGAVVGGILMGAQKIVQGMAMISFGDAKKRFEADAAAIGVALKAVDKDINGLIADNAKYSESHQAVQKSLGGFSSSLRTAADTMESSAKNYKFVNDETKAFDWSTIKLEEDLGLLGGTAGEAKEKVSQFAKTLTADMGDLAREWRAQPEAIRENKESIDILVTKYGELRAKVTDPSKLPADLERIYLAHLKPIVPVRDYTKALAGIGPAAVIATDADNMLAIAQDRLTRDGLIPSNRAFVEQEALMKAIPPTLHNANKEFADMRLRQAEAKEEAKRFAAEGIANLANAFANLAEISGGAFGGIVQYLGQVTAAMNIGNQAGNNLRGGFDQLAQGGMKNVAAGAISMVSGLTAGYGAMQAATNHATTAKNIFGGMATGMQTGAAIAGPWGAAVGAAVGAIWGAFKGKPDWSKIQEQIKKDFGVAVTEELAKQIEATNKVVKDKSVAIALNLSAVIEQAGGLTKANMLQFETQAFKLFGVIAKGGETGVKATQELNNVFGLFAQQLVNTGGLADDAFLKLLKGARESGVEMENVSKFIRAQVEGNIIGGLNQWAAKYGDVTATMGKDSRELADIEAKLLQGTTAQQKTELDKRAAELRANLEKGREATSTHAKLTEQEAYALTGSIAVAFTELRTQGVSTGEAIKQLSPIINTLDAELTRAGVDGGAAFNALRSLAKTAGDEIVSKAISSVDGLNNVMKGLHNIGIQDQDMFVGLASQIGKTYQDLIAQGKDGNDVMRLMQPTLQTLDELQRKFGLQIDATTQELLDEARASNLVGKEYESDQSRMVQATERMADVLEALAKFMGVDVPAAADAMGNAGEANLNDIAAKIRNGTIPTLQELQGVVRDPNAFHSMLANMADAAGGIHNLTHNQIIQALRQMQGTAADGGPWGAMVGNASSAAGNVVGSIRYEEESILRMYGVARDGGAFQQMAGNAQSAAIQGGDAFQNRLKPGVIDTYNTIGQYGAWGQLVGNAQSATGQARGYITNLKGEWGSFVDDVQNFDPPEYNFSSGGGGGGGSSSGGSSGGGGGGYSFSHPEVQAFLRANPGDEDRARRVYNFAKGGIANSGHWRWFAEAGRELAMPLPDFNRLLMTMGSNMAMQTQAAKDAYLLASSRGGGAGGGDIHLHVDARGSVFEAERAVDAFALRVGNKLADMHFRGTKARATT